MIERKVREAVAATSLTIEASPKLASLYRDLKESVVYLLKPDQIRGTDFGATKAISLLIAAPVAHERALQQLLGRVGRY